MKKIKKDYIANKQEFLHTAIKILLLGICIGLAVYMIFYAWSISASNAQSETFTELYFEDHLDLPSKVIPNHRRFFQFTLHNLENEDMQYPYEVYIEVGRNKLFIDKGAFFVRKNEFKTIQEEFVIASAFPRSKIVVNLINKNQQIDFWIEGEQ